MKKRMPRPDPADPRLPRYRASFRIQATEGETTHRPTAAARAARLRAQHAISGLRDPGGDLVVILRIAAARRQEDDERPRALGDYFDARVARGDDFARALGSLGGAGGDHDDKRQKDYFFILISAS